MVDLPAAAPTDAGCPAPAVGTGAAAGDAVVADTVRQLLHATDVEEIPGILVTAVDRLGGHTTVDDLESPHALPLDLSFGLGGPLLAAAAPGTPARTALEAHLPRLVEDARRAAERCRQQTSERRSGVADA